MATVPEAASKTFMASIAGASTDLYSVLEGIEGAGTCGECRLMWLDAQVPRPGRGWLRSEGHGRQGLGQPLQFWHCGQLGGSMAFGLWLVGGGLSSSRLCSVLAICAALLVGAARSSYIR
jgi:hypothetical protein